MASHIRVENLRRRRVLEFEEAEQDAYNNIVKEEEDRQRTIQELQHEEEVVLEMQKEHDLRIREQKYRQSIHENSPEIRELEKKLNYAYTNKERAIQIQEKNLRIEQEKLLSAVKNAEMHAALAKAEQEEKQKNRINMERAMEYNEALNRQLVEGEQKKKDEYEQFLKEKELIDQVVAKIIAENEREVKLRLEKQIDTKKFIEDFMVERQKWRESEIRLQEIENQKIIEYAKQQREREEMLAGQKKKIEEAKSGIYEKLASHQHEMERAKIELEDLRTNLALEEQEASARKKEQDALRNRVQKRLEMIEAYQRQVEFKRQKLESEKEDEKIMREQVIKANANPIS